ncbi:hypothetical protein ACQPYH_27710 [Kribbella sp. CA-245084]
MPTQPPPAGRQRAGVVEVRGDRFVRHRNDLTTADVETWPPAG